MKSIVLNKNMMFFLSIRRLAKVAQIKIFFHISLQIFILKFIFRANLDARHAMALEKFYSGLAVDLISANSLNS